MNHVLTFTILICCGGGGGESEGSVGQRDKKVFSSVDKNTFLFIWKRTKVNIYSEKKLNSLLSFELHPNLKKT